MAVIVHGFPNKYSALQFEWCWQNLGKSRHFSKAITSSYLISHAPTTLLKRRNYDFHTNLSMLSDLLHLPFWSRFPLQIHFTSVEFHDLFLNCHLQAHCNASSTKLVKKKRNAKATDSYLPIPVSAAPSHMMNFTIGPLSDLPPKILGDSDVGKQEPSDGLDCDICLERLFTSKMTPGIAAGSWLYCAKSCSSVFHIHCLAKWFLYNEQLDALRLSSSSTSSSSSPQLPVIASLDDFKFKLSSTSSPLSFDHLVPVSGSCPCCQVDMKWGELIALVNRRVLLFSGHEDGDDEEEEDGEEDEDDDLDDEDSP